MLIYKKVAYYGSIQLMDIDFSYLHEAQKMTDITYYLELSPRFMNGPALSIKKIHTKSGIFKACDVYKEFSKYAGFIDLDKVYVINTVGHLWLLKSLCIHFLLLIRWVTGRYNVIHLAWPLNLYQLILYILKKKMILTVHDPFPHSFQDTKIVRLRRKIAFSLIFHFIILNQKQKDKFINYNNLRNKHVIDSRLSSYNILQTIDICNNCVLNNYEYIYHRIKPFRYLLNIH